MVQFNKLLFLFICFTLLSANIKPKWKPIGPFKTPNPRDSFNGWSANGLGRIFDIYPHPSNINKLYAASPNGGIFYSKNRGKEWKRLPMPCPGGVIKMANRIIDKNINITIASNVSSPNRQSYSYGIYNSADNGKTWDTLVQLVPQEYQLKAIKDMVWIGNKLLYLIDKDLYSYQNDSVLLLRKFNFDPQAIIVNPLNNNELIIAGNQLVRSTDGAQTFKPININDPSGKSIAFVQSHAAFSPNGCALLIHNKSRDYVLTFDNNFNFIQSKAIQSSIDIARCKIYYHASSSSFLIAGIRLHQFKDNQIKQITAPDYPSKKYVHDDIRGVSFDAQNNILLANDAGLSISEDNGISWLNIAGCGLNITEVYDFDYDSSMKQLFYGAQDLGIFKHQIGEKLWQHCTQYYGDGGSCVVANKQWYFMKGISLLQSTNQADQSKYQNAALAVNRFNPALRTFNGNLYLGTQHLMEKKGEVWKNLSPDLPSDYFLADFLINENCTLIAKQDPAWNPERPFGKLFIKTDENWRDITANLGSALIYKAFSGLSFGNTVQEIYACSDYFDNANGGREKVYFSNDQGETWTNISYNLPNVPCTFIKNIPNKGIYLGTDLGLFRLKGDQWEYISPEVPKCPAMELLQVNDQLILATYGAGFWVLEE